MSDADPSSRDGEAAKLARAFDGAFALPRARGTEDVESLLGFRVAENDYAVRLKDVRGLIPAPRIVPVPSPVSELLGVAGLRGNIVPIYNLRALLGHSPTADRPSPSSAWIILVGADTQIGLALEHLTGHLRVQRREISAAQEQGAKAHVRETVRIGETLREIISVESVMANIRARAG